ncbi:MAG: hypothetical protein ACRCZB_04280 [Bacteroidales bacterium]
MAIGNLYIDNIDVYERYGLVITRNGYNELLSYPPLKKIAVNQWQEEDGEEVDLLQPELDTKEFTLSLALSGAESNLGAFNEALADGAYHEWNFKAIDKIYILRLVSTSSFKAARNLYIFKLRLADDYPLRGYNYIPPVSKTNNSNYEIDGRNLADYGITALQGCIEEIQKPASVKKNLLQNINNEPGAKYDDKNVTYQSKEVRLNLLMRASTLNDFWRNYNAFLYDLKRPNERSLFVDSLGYEYACYYKSCSIKNFICRNENALLQFSISLQFINFRLQGPEWLLSSEDDKLIITENGFCIDLKPLQLAKDYLLLSSEDDKLISTEDGFYIDLKKNKVWQ